MPFHGHSECRPRILRMGEKPEERVAFSGCCRPVKCQCASRRNGVASMGKLGPITPQKFERFLKYAGCEFIRQKGSHKVYRRADLIRPVIVPFHCGDLPTYVVR